MAMVNCKTCLDKKVIETLYHGKVGCPQCNPNYREELVPEVDSKEYQTVVPPKGACETCGRTTGCMHGRHKRVTYAED